MTKPEYGSREFYREMFADFVIDINPDQPEIVHNVVDGFFDALKMIRDHHAASLAEMNKAIDLATNQYNDTQSNIQS